jgi:4'-phosphopantetheinyl transferase EntD
LINILDQRSMETGSRDRLVLGLVQRLRARLPGGMHLLGEPVADHTADLHEAELALIERAADLRKREFSTGRRLAHHLLARLIPDHGPLLRGPQREPSWPPGTVGSISHSAGLCAVSVGSSESFRGIGLDLQIASPALGLASSILSDSELASRHSAQQLRLKFSAKEAVFKCLFPINGSYLAFRDLTVALGDAQCTFTASSAALGGGDELRAGEGLYFENEEAVVTAFWIPAR